jgi:hypothetical protein
VSQGRSATIVAVVSLALLAGLALVLPTAASADSGTGSIYTLPDSQELEGSVQITHECTESPCPWFAEVSAYPAATECPRVFDLSHSVWVGEVKESPKGSWSSFGRFAFTPEESGYATLCLYVNSGSANDLVGNVTRAPPPEEAPPNYGPNPTSVTLKVKRYDADCRAHVYAVAHGAPIPVPSGDAYPLGNEVVAKLTGPKGRRLVAEPSASPSAFQEVWAVVGPRGSYAITVHYPGSTRSNGSTLWMASKPVTARFALGRCAR